jgi:hypothetical protein
LELSNRLTPVSRKELIRRLSCMNFEGPYPGGDHEYMTRSGIYVRLPSTSWRGYKHQALI